jgi:hypothetical protein
MASTLGDFTLSAVAAPDDFIVGYDEAALNGERRWTVSTIANAVSGIITPSFTNVFGESYGLFRKSDPSIAAWTKTANFNVSTGVTLYVEVDGRYVQINSGTIVTMPSPTIGTDYAIWAKPDGTLEATANHTSGPVAGSRKIGGFHYAAGGNATAQAGGNTTPQINEYSFWDLKFRPNCPDPRGMTLVADSFWADIYLCGVDHTVNGTSKYNVTIADGGNPPKIPLKFGGNGTTAYANSNWWNLMEVLKSHGKRGFTYAEFAAAAYGTTEATSSGGTDVPTTGVTGTGATSPWNVFTSKWGVIQSTGCMSIWGDEFGGGNAGASWTANTQGRGSTYQMENTVFFGGDFTDSSASGSRCSTWFESPSYSSTIVDGVRGACDHLSLD